jgi:hypothetical protein
MIPVRVFVDQVTIGAGQTDWMQVVIGNFVFPGVIAFILYWLSKRTIFEQLLKDKAASERYEIKRLILRIGGNARVIALLLHQAKNTVDYIKETGRDFKDAGISEDNTRVATLNQELMELDLLLELEIVHCFSDDFEVKRLYASHRKRLEEFVALVTQPVKEETDNLDAWIDSVDKAAQGLYETEKPLLEEILH